MDKAVFMGLQPMPLNQDIEQGHREPQPHGEVGPDAMHEVLEMTDVDQHRQDGFDEHADIPCAARTDLEGIGMPVDLVEALIGEDHHLTVDPVDDFLEGPTIVDVGGIARPIDD